MKIVTVNESEIERLYERFSPLPANDEYRGEGGKVFFTHALRISTLVVELDYGIVRVTDYTPGDSITIHALFDKKSVMGNISELRQVGSYLLRLFSVSHIKTVVPREGRGVQRLLKRVGFNKGPTLCGSSFNGKIYTDAVLYWANRRDLL